MSPGERAMPIVNATWWDGSGQHGWLIALPDGRTVLAPTRDEALVVIDRNAPGSAIRWTGSQPTATMSAMQQTFDAR